MKLGAGFFLVASLASAGEWTNDIEYEKRLGLKLDAWVPEGKGRFPTAIVVHGGGWVGGDKRIEWVQPLFEPLQKADFTIFTINYRLSPQTPYPAMIHDLESAIAWVKDNSKKYKVDKGRIALIGESAGGHMVALVGARGRGDSDVAAVVDFYGPHDLLKLAQEKDGGDLTRLAKNIFQQPGNKDAEWKLREASPIQYVRKGMPPFLFIHGTADASVPFNQSPLMCDKMKSMNNKCEVFPIEGAPHGMSNWEKNPAFQTYKPKMIEWLKATLRD